MVAKLSLAVKRVPKLSLGTRKAAVPGNRSQVLAHSRQSTFTNKVQSDLRARAQAPVSGLVK